MICAIPACMALAALGLHLLGSLMSNAFKLPQAGSAVLLILAIAASLMRALPVRQKSSNT